MPILKFGDGLNGAIPPLGQTIFGTYKVTEGDLGNLPPNTLTISQTSFLLPDWS
jgi:hypothetical protein